MSIHTCSNLLVICCCAIINFAESVTWLSDFIDVTVSTDFNSICLDLRASRFVIPAARGQLKLAILYDGQRFNTSCIPYGAEASVLTAALPVGGPIDNLGGINVVKKGDGSSEYNFGFVYNLSAANSSVNLVDELRIEHVGSGTSHNCSRLSTFGFWDDAANWDTNLAPADSDEVTIPADSGFIALAQDTFVSSLTVSGGAIITHQTTCLAGWTPAPGGTSASFGSRKCYRFFPYEKTWSTAQTACASSVGSDHVGSRGGAWGGTLVSVQGLDENQWVRRICKGGTSQHDCWIGLTRSSTTENGRGNGHPWEWAGEASATEHGRYRSWDFLEVSESAHAEARHRCVAMHNSRHRAVDELEAHWYDEKCSAEKPFVCEAFGVSKPFSLTVSTQFVFAAGYIIGAGSIISSGLAQVSGAAGEVGVLNGATLVNDRLASMEYSAPYTIGWGGTIRNKGILNLKGAVTMDVAKDDAGFWEDDNAAWPVVVNDVTGDVIVSSESNAQLAWSIWNDGGNVTIHGRINCTGGGYSTSGTIAVHAAGDALFSHGSFLMFQVPAYTLNLRADREVTGQDVELASEMSGYYRLDFGGQETECIGYHSSAGNVQRALGNLPDVKAAGGATVRREGNGMSEKWHYGYRYDIVFDGARALTEGHVLSVSCFGSTGGCGCVDISGVIGTAGGTHLGCGSAIFGLANASTSAMFDASDCRVQATVQIDEIHAGGETIVAGDGTVVFSQGGHTLLPSRVEPNIEVHGAAVVVVSQWSAQLAGSVNVTSDGLLWFAGADWNSQRSVELLHAHRSTSGRAAGTTASPPDFNSTIGKNVALARAGEVRLAATPNAILDVLGSFTFGGGGVSGRGRVTVRGLTVFEASGTPSRSWLTLGVTLDLYGGGAWSGGDVRASDGASVVNRGSFDITAVGTIFGKDEQSHGQSPKEFDDVHIPYENPLCADRCSSDLSWENTAGAEIRGATGSDALLVCVLRNEGTVVIEDGARLEWRGEGEGGGSGSIALPGYNSTTIFSAGSFIFDTSSNVSGNGVIEFRGGAGHQLPAAVSPLVKVSGHGVLASGNSDLLLEKGLTVTDHGSFLLTGVNSFTTIVEDLTLHGAGVIAFPHPVAAPYESLLAPELGVFPSWDPRGTHSADIGWWNDGSRSLMSIHGTFFWSGGVISGNGMIRCLGQSEWSGNSHPKAVVDSLILVSKGDIVWTQGDVLASRGATFINRGSLLLRESGDSDSFVSPRIRTPRPGEANALAKRTSLARGHDDVAARAPRVEG